MTTSSSLRLWMVALVPMMGVLLSGPRPAQADEAAVQESTAVAQPPPASGNAQVYDLPALLALAHRLNPGLKAGNRATAQIRAQLSEANRSWLPSGEILSLVAPAPSVKCTPSPDMCLQTEDREVTLKFQGVLSRTEIRLVQPLYTFGKISAGIDAAEAGIEASRGRELAMRGDLDMNIKRGYFGFKLAREVLETLKEGLEFLDEADKRVQKDLDAGTGNMTVTDKLRLKTVRAELDVRMLEAKRGMRLAENALRALIGLEGPRVIGIDAAPLEQADVVERPLSAYEEQARLSRPEVRALDFFVKAKKNLALLEWRQQLPDLVLIATARFAYAPSIDDPRYAFANDPFNSRAAGLAAALRMPLDFGVKNARATKLRAEAEEAEFRRLEALGGLAFEVEKAHTELSEARERIVLVAGAEKISRRWITSIMQKMELGLAEAKEVSDALTKFFTMRVLYLQALHDFNIAAAALSRATGGDITR